MSKTIGIFGIAGAVWMTILLSTGSFKLESLTNYPGIYAARWIQYKGIAPPLAYAAEAGNRPLELTAGATAS